MTGYSLNFLLVSHSAQESHTDPLQVWKLAFCFHGTLELVRQDEELLI